MTFAAPDTVAARPILPLRRFQERACGTILNILHDTSVKIAADPGKRQAIALAQGVTLLRSPTGSGKTLTVGRALERATGTLPRKTCWFWFTPYSGLVAQTQDALKAQCPGIRLRDLRTDRHVGLARDGDVFIATWASVASAKKDAKLARRNLEMLPGLDLFIAALRADGWNIGTVIDEAHLNFGSGAQRAAEFYLEVLAPDFTILVTATPKDDDLARFERAAGIGKVNRIEISRRDVVAACLNKSGIRAVHFRPDEKDARLLDMPEVALLAGWTRHVLVREALAARGVDLKPLLMVQVENEEKGGPDPIARAVDFLKGQGVPADMIATHSSGDPDPYFHTLAYDERKEVLVFKVSAATGFDAPRAWTLVSLRRTIDAGFGMQVLGRIMRVHPRVQHLHPYATLPARPADDSLDFGYVFLANPDASAGIVQAAHGLKTIQDGIETVTDNVRLVDFGGSRTALLNPDTGFAELLEPAPSSPLSDFAAASPVRAAALRTQDYLDFALTMPLTPPRTTGNSAPVRHADPSHMAYRLRQDITFPRQLAREVMPRTMDGLVACIARRIRIDDSVLNLVHRTMGKVHVTEQDVFGDGAAQFAIRNVPVSNARIAQEAQAAFRFNEGIDERDLKPALLEQLRRKMTERGMSIPGERDLRRAVDLLAMVRPDLLHDACRECLSAAVEIRQDEDIPAQYYGPVGLEQAEKALYGVFPQELNAQERAFARLLDNDASGTVLWWMRNTENARWAVSIVLPTGRRHFPDFVIGVNVRRKALDNIALAEIKDDGTTGRLYSSSNTDKVRTQHARYGSALMVCRNDQGEWLTIAYRPDLRSHRVGDLFNIQDLEFTQ